MPCKIQQQRRINFLRRGLQLKREHLMALRLRSFRYQHVTQLVPDIASRSARSRANSRGIPAGVPLVLRLDTAKPDKPNPSHIATLIAIATLLLLIFLLSGLKDLRDSLSGWYLTCHPERSRGIYAFCLSPSDHQITRLPDHPITRLAYEESVFALPNQYSDTTRGPLN